MGAYKQSKFLAEREVTRLVNDTGMPIVRVKPAAPSQWRTCRTRPQPKTWVLPKRPQRTRMPAYVNTGLNVVHVDDVADGGLLAYKDKCESYILGGENRTLQWILETVAELTGQRPPRIRLPHWFVTPMASPARKASLHIRGFGEPARQETAFACPGTGCYFSIERARRRVRCYSPRPAVEALQS